MLKLFIFLSFILLALFSYIRVKAFSKLKSHVEEAYPDEWERLCNNPMNMKLSEAISVNLRESISKGFLSQQKDPFVSGYHLRNRVMDGILVCLVIVQFAVAYWL